MVKQIDGEEKLEKEFLSPGESAEPVKYMHIDLWKWNFPLFMFILMEIEWIWSTVAEKTT